MLVRLAFGMIVWYCQLLCLLSTSKIVRVYTSRRLIVHVHAWATRTSV